MSDGWRDVWDFDDLELSEQRFRVLLDEADEPAARAAVLTQLARVEGLRDRFAAGESLLAEAEAIGGAAGWATLERGRLLRSSGDEEGALPRFEAAFALASEQGDGFLAADAAHMAALVGDAEAWTTRGIEVARSSDDPAARYWLGPLLNNIGWVRFEAGDLTRALAAFDEALEIRAGDPARPHAREIARYAVGKALRGLGRLDEATAQLELAVGWATEAGVETPYFHEELAECYAAAGKPVDARAEARRALALLGNDAEAGRLERLRLLAAA